MFIHGDNGSGILNVIETNKHLSTKQNHWVVQTILQFLVIRLLRTTTLFIRATLFFLLETRPIGRQNETCDAIGLNCGAKEPPTAEAS